MSRPVCSVWMPTSQEKGLTQSTVSSRRASGLMLHMKSQQIGTISKRRTTKMVCSLARRSLAPHVLIFWSAIAALGHTPIPSVTDLILKYLAMLLPSLYFRLNPFLHKLLKSTWVAPRSSELSRSGQPGHSCAPVFRRQKISAPGRRAFPTNKPSSRTLTLLQQVLDLLTEMWQQSRRHAQI